MKLKSLLDYPTTEQMSIENSKCFLNILGMDMATGALPPNVTEMAEQDAICRITKSRLGLAGVTATVPLLLWIHILADGNPGKAVMWAYTLCHIAEKKGEMNLNVSDLVDEFPNGFSTEDAMHDCWGAQKRKPDFSKGIGDDSMDDPSFWCEEAVTS